MKEHVLLYYNCLLERRNSVLVKSEDIGPPLLNKKRSISCERTENLNTGSAVVLGENLDAEFLFVTGNLEVLEFPARVWRSAGNFDVNGYSETDSVCDSCRENAGLRNGKRIGWLVSAAATEVNEGENEQE